MMQTLNMLFKTYAKFDALGAVISYAIALKVLKKQRYNTEILFCLLCF